MLREILNALARLFDYYRRLGRRVIDETKHCASGGLSVDRYANGHIGADHECAIADGRRLRGRRRRPIAGRGAGIFLQKGKSLVYCYVTEKPGSAALDTQYCKPVK